jgi:hypothetical protein
LAAARTYTLPNNNRSEVEAAEAEEAEEEEEEGTRTMPMHHTATHRNGT